MLADADLQGLGQDSTGDLVAKAQVTGHCATGSDLVTAANRIRSGILSRFDFGKVQVALCAGDTQRGTAAGTAVQIEIQFCSRHQATHFVNIEAIDAGAGGGVAVLLRLHALMHDGQRRQRQQRKSAGG